MFKLIRKVYFTTIVRWSEKFIIGLNSDPDRMIKILEKEPSLFRYCDIFVFQDRIFMNQLLKIPGFDKDEFVSFLISKLEKDKRSVSVIVKLSEISSDKQIMEKLVAADGSFFGFVNGGLANDYFYNLAVNAKREPFVIEDSVIYSRNLSENSIRWWYEKDEKSISKLLRSGNKVPFDILKDECTKGNIDVSLLDNISLDYLSKEEFVELCQIDGRFFVAAGPNTISLDAYECAISNVDPNKCFSNDFFKEMNFNLFADISNEEFLTFCRKNSFFFLFFKKDFDLEEAYKIILNNQDKVDIIDIINDCQIKCVTRDIISRLVDLDGRFLKLSKQIDLDLYRRAKANGFDLKFGLCDGASYKNCESVTDEYVGEFITLITEEPELLNHIKKYFFNIKEFVKVFVKQIVKENIDFPISFEIINQIKDTDTMSFNKLTDYFRDKLYKNELSKENLNILFNYFANSKKGFGQDIIKKICEVYDIDSNFLNYHIICGSKVNREFVMNLNPQMLQDKYRILYEEKGHDAYNKLYILGTFPSIQEKIINIGKYVTEDSLDLGNKRIQLLKLMLDSAIVNSDSKDIEEWIPNFSYVVEYVNRKLPMFSYFAEHLEELDQDQIMLLTSHALGYHKFTINSIEELENYDNIRNKYIEQLYVKGDLASVKEAFLEEQFGVSPLVYRRLLMFKTGVLEAKDKYDKEIVDLFKKIDSIDSVTDVKKLLEARDKTTPLEFGRFNSQNNFRYLHLMLGIKHSILKEYNDTLYKVNDNEEYVEYGGCKFFKVAGEDGTKPFSLSITSLGAYSYFDVSERGFSFSENWNMPLVASHGICSSYIANNNLGTARVNFAILGFVDYEEGALLTCGPYDLVSNSSNKTFDSFSNLSKSMFLRPRNLIDYTRHTHNECVFERRYQDGKRQPNYVVLDVDDLQSALSLYEEYRKKGRYLTKRGINQDDYNKNAIIKTADLVYYALKCSKDFGIPIVVVEREKIAKNEWKKIALKLKDVMTKKDFSQEDIKEFFHDTLVEFENNAVGSTFHPNIAYKYFNYNNASFIVDTIKSKITVLMYENPVLAVSFLDELESVCQLETEKIDLFRKNENHSGIEFSELKEFVNHQRKVITNDKKASHYISDVLSGKIGDTECLMEYSTCFGSKEGQYFMSDIVSLFNNNKQLSTKVNLNINMINTYGLYVDCEATSHSRKHAENVVLFSAVVGHSIGIEGRDMDLLLAAATFHDAGRQDDRNSSHAALSAALVGEKLIDIYDADELGMIQAIIEFHETRERKDENGNIDYRPLYALCEKYGLDKSDKALMKRCSKLSSVLKDADALDRTRFVSSSRAFLRQEFLRHDVSKKLFKVGIQISEYYAKKDIERILDDSPELITSFESALKKTSSPKEVIRMYRKGRMEIEKINESEVVLNGGKK